MTYRITFASIYLFVKEEKITKRFILFLLSIFILSSCATHTSIPNISIKTSKGIKYKESVFFISEYNIYFRPTGIAKFPDGGSRVYVGGGLYLMSYDMKANVLQKLQEIKIDGRVPFPQYAEFSILGNKMIIAFKYYPAQTNSQLTDIYFEYNCMENTLKQTEPESFEPYSDRKSIIGYSETKDYFNEIFDYSNIGLPDPVAVVKHDDKSLRKMLSEKYIDLRFKYALIGFIIKNNKYYLIEETRLPGESSDTDEIIESIESRIGGTSKTGKEKIPSDESTGYEKRSE